MTNGDENLPEQRAKRYIQITESKYEGRYKKVTNISNISLTIQIISTITGDILLNELKEVLNQVTVLKAGNVNFGECQQIIVEFPPKKPVPTGRTQKSNFKTKVSIHPYKSFGATSSRTAQDIANDRYKWDFYQVIFFFFIFTQMYPKFTKPKWRKQKRFYYKSNYISARYWRVNWVLKG